MESNTNRMKLIEAAHKVAQAEWLVISAAFGGGSEFEELQSSIQEVEKKLLSVAMGGDPGDDAMRKLIKNIHTMTYGIASEDS